MCTNHNQPATIDTSNIKSHSRPLATLMLRNDILLENVMYNNHASEIATS
jgi:hypothetical protein